MSRDVANEKPEVRSASAVYLPPSRTVVSLSSRSSCLQSKAGKWRGRLEGVRTLVKSCRTTHDTSISVINGFREPLDFRWREVRRDFGENLHWSIIDKFVSVVFLLNCAEIDIGSYLYDTE